MTSRDYSISLGQFTKAIESKGAEVQDEAPTVLVYSLNGEDFYFSERGSVVTVDASEPIHAIIDKAIAGNA